MIDGAAVTVSSFISKMKPSAAGFSGIRCVAALAVALAYLAVAAYLVMPYASQHAAQQPAPAEELLRPVASSAAAAATSSSTSNHRFAAAFAAAAKQPVLIGIVGHSGQWPFLQAAAAGTFTAAQPWHERNCSWDGVPINCTFTKDTAQFPAADGLYFHIPTHKGKLLERAHPRQIRFGVTLESSVYYPW